MLWILHKSCVRRIEATKTSSGSYQLNCGLPLQRSSIKPKCIPFILALNQLPQSLEVLELTGIYKYVLEDIAQRLTVTGSFSSLMRLREVPSEHEEVLLHLRAAGAPLTTHLHFVHTTPNKDE